MFAFADDITVFVSHRLNIKAVKKAVAMYEPILGAKIYFYKSEGLRLRVCRGGIPFSGPFRCNDRPICILGAWFGPGLELKQNWSEVKAMVDVQVGT